MIVYTITIGNHDKVYLKYFLDKEKALTFKKECENAISREEWENLPNIMAAEKEWRDYKTFLNVKFPKKNIVDLPEEYKSKWFELISKWSYNPHYGHSEYYIEEINVEQ